MKMILETEISNLTRLEKKEIKDYILSNFILRIRQRKKVNKFLEK